MSSPGELVAPEVEWLVLCDCTDRGEADGPSPGPNPGLCATCGDRVRGEWIPTVADPKGPDTMQPLHPSITNGRGDPPDDRPSKAGSIVATVILVLLGAVTISILVLVLVVIWRAIL